MAVETLRSKVSVPYYFAGCPTLADFALIGGVICLEVIGMDLSPFPMLKHWYDSFKINCKDLWTDSGGQQCLDELNLAASAEQDLSKIKHPLHPTDKSKLK